MLFLVSMLVFFVLQLLAFVASVALCTLCVCIITKSNVVIEFGPTEENPDKIFSLSLVKEKKP